ncbi:squalene cyclase [Klenkia sp. LSe6-5]|uniref:Squalene cyclase n=1 Tax=Klenkia sesuvii TaxID=3103137 RepID=A0ABU8DN23_9ACTN
MADDVLTWLLDGDPALRWQVERDLLDAPPEVWQATRARVATEGFGARLLAHQDPDGQWAGGAYFPRPDGDPTWPEGEGQPWTATTWSLTALREWGCDPTALGDTAERLAAGCRWEYDDLPYWGGEVDVCINATTLANGVWLGVDVEDLAHWFPEHQLADGGWNCAWVEGSTVSSVHSTLNAVRGLLAHEIATGGDDALRAARHRGEEHLLARHLLHRSDGELLDACTTPPVAPSRWRYDVLRVLEHLRLAGLHDGTAPDPRAAEAVDRLRAGRGADGRWRQGPVERGAVWFDVDVPEGEPSRWLTLGGERVLRWWDAGQQHP